jgi:putative hemolysin
MTVPMVLVLLLIVVAWLTAAATAVRSTSRIWLRHWVEQRLSGAATAELYLERPQRLLIAAGTGIAIAVFAGGLLIGAGSAAAAEGRLAMTARVAGTALVVLVLGQVVPRVVARRWAARLVPALLPALRLIELVVSPLAAGARAAARWFVAGPAGAGRQAPRSHLDDLLREGELEGVGDRREIAIISGVVQFVGKTVQLVMTPRSAVFAVAIDTPPAETARLIAQSGYSRVPVYRGSLDDIVGMIHVFDVLNGRPAARITPRPVARASASRHCNELLFEMLQGGLHMAVVRDTAGQTLGIVTLEDLLEELVGDIRDEFDEPQPAPVAPARAPAA